MAKNIICIYHGNCADGFGAAWAVRNALGKEIEFHPGVYQEDPPDVTAKDVILVDFSYKKPVLEKMAEKARSVLILDHHKSAFEDLQGYDSPADYWEDHIKEVEDMQDPMQWLFPSIIRARFNMQKSGAIMAWEFFNPDEEAPLLLKHIQDRDLWKFELEGTRQIQATLFSYPYHFSTWSALIDEGPAKLIRDGNAIERKHHKDIKEFIAAAKCRFVIDGCDVPTLNAPYFYSSDAGHIMAQGEPFAACYWDTPSGRVFSLRSSNEGLDVSVIAAKFGGGGHKNAAGFTVGHDHPLANPFNQ